MFIPEDKSLPYSLRKSRAVELQYKNAESHVNEQSRLRSVAESINRVVRTNRRRNDPESLIIERLAFTQKCREAIRVIYNQEYHAYADILDNAKLSESEGLERKMKEIEPHLQRKQEKKLEFNRQEYDKLFEENCDDVRQLKYKVNDRAAALTLDYQVRRKQEEEEEWKLQEMTLDQPRIDDFKHYESELKDEAIRKRMEIKEREKEIEVFLGEEQAFAARQEAYRLIELQKEKELTQQHELIEQLERDVECERKLQNRLFLETEIEVQKAKEACERVKRIYEERDDISRINEDIRKAAIEEMKAKELLRDDQACYMLLLEYRERVKNEEIAQLEEFYHQAILQGKEAEDIRKIQEHKHELAIEKSCYEYNVDNANNAFKRNEMHRRLEIEEEKAEELEKQRLAEEERLIEMQNKLDSEREWVEFLKIQKLRRMELQQEALRREERYCHNRSEEQEMQHKKTRALIETYENQIKDITDAYWSEPVSRRPRL